MIPLYVLCYQNAKWLRHTVSEMQRTKVEGRVNIWDDGSTDPDMLEAIDEVDATAPFFFAHRNPHLGYREQFIAIGEHAAIGTNLWHTSDYYCYIEDDVQFSVNWLAYAEKKLKELLAAGYPVGVLALYTGHAHVKKQVLPHVYEHHGEHFYGTCGLIINTAFVPELAKAIRGNLNCDIAIRELLSTHEHPQWKLYGIIPTLMQHLGKDTRLNAPFHQSSFVLSPESDALKVML